VFFFLALSQLLTICRRFITNLTILLSDVFLPAIYCWSLPDLPYVLPVVSFSVTETPVWSLAGSALPELVDAVGYQLQI